MAQDARLLDTSRADTKVWLVKVPPAVAQVWRPLCEASLLSTGSDEDVKAVELGTVRMAVPTQSAEGGPETEMVLCVKGAEARGLPSQYRLNRIPAGTTTTAAVTYKAPEQEGEEPSQMRVDGTVDVERNFNLMPVHKVDKHGNLEIDAAYRSQSKKRTIQSAIKTHSVKNYEDSRENRVATLAVTKRIMDQKRQVALQKEEKKDNKRTRREQADVEAELFRMFEKHQYLPFAAMQAETNQPTMYLKEILAKICLQVKQRGDFKDHYYLKPEYGGPAGISQ